MNTVKYLLGIDGGGTKTEFLLTDTHGNEVRRLFLGGSNPVNKGIENTRLVLSEGIEKICEGIDMGEVSVFAGIAGSKAGKNRELISAFLSEFGFALFGCGSDIDLALEAALNGADGTAVIMGTGIVAYSRFDGKMYRTGGWGYMIDKGGSGFHFGSDALRAAFGFADGTGGSETVMKLVEKKLGKGLEESVAEIYSGGASYVASFAPTVFEAFELGDEKACEIVDRNACEAAKIINAARSLSAGSDEKIVICGGLCKQKNILRPYLMKYIEDGASLTFLDKPMVYGAVSLALRRMKDA